MMGLAAMASTCEDNFSLASYVADPNRELSHWTFLTEASLTTFCNRRAGPTVVVVVVTAAVDAAAKMGGDADKASDILTEADNTKRKWRKAS
jgi:hypothetical protein